MNEELLTLKHEKEVHRGGSKDSSLGKIQKSCLRARDKVRKAKVLIELKLAKDMKGNKKIYCRYTDD